MMKKICPLCSGIWDAAEPTPESGLYFCPLHAKYVRLLFLEKTAKANDNSKKAAVSGFITGAKTTALTGVMTKVGLMATGLS